MGSARATLSLSPFLNLWENEVAMLHLLTESPHPGCGCASCAKVRRVARKEAAPHGTRGGYVNWGCRCALCREAQRVYMVRRRRNGDGNRL